MLQFLSLKLLVGDHLCVAFLWLKAVEVCAAALCSSRVLHLNNLEHFMDSTLTKGKAWIESEIEAATHDPTLQYEWKTMTADVYSLEIWRKGLRIGQPIRFSSWELLYCGIGGVLQEKIRAKQATWLGYVKARRASPFDPLDKQCPRCGSANIRSSPIAAAGSRASGGAVEGAQLFGQMKQEMVWECPDCNWVSTLN